MITTERLNKLIEAETMRYGVEYPKEEHLEIMKLARLGLEHEKLGSIYGTPEAHRLMRLGEWAEKHRGVIDYSIHRTSRRQDTRDLAYDARECIAEFHAAISKDPK